MASVGLRYAVSTAVSRNELHLHFGLVMPEYPLDMNSVGHVCLVRFRRAGISHEPRDLSPATRFRKTVGQGFRPAGVAYDCYGIVQRQLSDRESEPA
jgi:hypothetical protein